MLDRQASPKGASMASIEDRILATIQERATTEVKVTRATRLEELGLDSLEVIEGIFAVEDEFGIRIELDSSGTYAGFESMDDVIAVVEAKVAQRL